MRACGTDRHPQKERDSTSMESKRSSILIMVNPIDHYAAAAGQIVRHGYWGRLFGDCRSRAAVTSSSTPCRLRHRASTTGRLGLPVQDRSTLAGCGLLQDHELACIRRLPAVKQSIESRGHGLRSRGIDSEPVDFKDELPRSRGENCSLICNIQIQKLQCV